MTTSLTEAPRTGFDTAAAVTRSLLGWGVVAGPFYVTVGIVLAATHPGSPRAPSSPAASNRARRASARSTDAG